MADLHEVINEKDRHDEEQHEGHLRHRLGPMQPHDAIKAGVSQPLQHKEHRMRLHLATKGDTGNYSPF